MNDIRLRSRSPLEQLPFSSAPGRGVIVTDRHTVAIARVVARAGRIADIARRARQRYGIELPRGPRCAEGRELSFIALGVDTWLVTSGLDASALTGSLKDTLAECAAITDQSSAHALLSVTGAKVRETLAKIVPLDLHPRAFPVGCAASTGVSHVGISLWRRADEPDDDGTGRTAAPGGGAAVFEIAVPRSYAVSFWHSLTWAAAEFGFVLAQRSLADGGGSTR